MSLPVTQGQTILIQRFLSESNSSNALPEQVSNGATVFKHGGVLF